MLRGIFERKSLSAILASAEAPGASLKRTLGPVQLTLLGVGAIIGAGIFVLTGHAAAANAGPAIALSFVLGAIVCAFAGMCYAEMASTVPISGSAYTYAYATMGELIAWVIGWDLILEYALGATTVAIGWSGYVVSFLKGFGIVIPPAFAEAPLAYDAATGSWQTTGTLLNIPAMLVIRIGGSTDIDERELMVDEATDDLPRAERSFDDLDANGFHLRRKLAESRDEEGWVDGAMNFDSFGKVEDDVRRKGLEAGDEERGGSRHVERLDPMAGLR